MSSARTLLPLPLAAAGISEDGLTHTWEEGQGWLAPSKRRPETTGDPEGLGEGRGLESRQAGQLSGLAFRGEYGVGDVHGGSSVTMGS